jgi:hypothetical protein
MEPLPQPFDYDVEQNILCGDEVGEMKHSNRGRVLKRKGGRGVKRTEEQERKERAREERCSPLREGSNIAKRVGNNLDLNVMRIFNELLNEHCIISKGT